MPVAMKNSQVTRKAGLPWIDPSPNMRHLTAAMLYPGLGILETTNVSVGRGTDRPFGVNFHSFQPGADQVVATLRPVDDDGARELARRFYAAGGVDDPVRALADAQAALALTPNAEWPQFAVFGTDVCSRRP